MNFNDLFCYFNLYINYSNKPPTPHLVSHVDAATAQVVDIIFAFVHEAADKPVVTEDDTGHLGDVLVALVLTDVVAVIHQTRHQVALPPLHFITFLYLQGW